MRVMSKIWRHLRISLMFALVPTAICVIAWAERVTLLQGAADLWAVSDPITEADAAVVLGGGLDMRPFIAADLYQKGLVRKILVSQAEDGRAVQIGAVSGHTMANVNVLRKLGIPDAAIEIFGNGNKNTRDEAVALAKWTKQHPVYTIIIPVEPFFSRRARWIFTREFLGTKVNVEILSSDPPDGYSRAQWWRTSEGVITFESEVLKYLYYRVTY